MEIICSVCDKPFDLPLSSVSNRIIENPVFCSPCCFSFYIKHKIAGLNGFSFVKRRAEKTQLSDAGESEYGVWSSTLLMSFRSDFERVVALYLRKRQHRFWYEQVSIKVGTKTYTPDFYLPEACCFIEVKGVWGAGSKAKYKKAMKLLYSHESLILIPIGMKAQFKKEVRV